MKNLYKSALGKAIDMDQIRLNNEDVIAVGNMKVNARGDELGPGGTVAKSRNEVMKEYYKLNTPTVDATRPPIVAEEDVLVDRNQEPQTQSNGRLRGSLADSISKSEE
jgi:hypothetical protein